MNDNGYFYLSQMHHFSGAFSSGKWKTVNDSVVFFVSSIDTSAIDLMKMNDSIYMYEYIDHQRVLDDINIPVANNLKRYNECIPKASVLLSYEQNKSNESVEIVFPGFDELRGFYSSKGSKSPYRISLSVNEEESIEIRKERSFSDFAMPIKNICITIHPDTSNYIFVNGHDVIFNINIKEDRCISKMEVSIDKYLSYFAEFMPLELEFVVLNEALRMKYKGGMVNFEKVNPKEITMPSRLPIDFLIEDYH